MYEKNLEKLVTRLEKTGATLIWATTTPACPKPEHKIHILVTPETQRKYREAALRVMKKHGVEVNDLHAFIAPVRGKYARGGRDDDVHYTKDGYRQLAGKVAGAIRAALNDAAPAGGSEKSGK